MSSEGMEPVAPIVEHFFRREAGRLVAVLTRLFGWRNFDLVEDMVQETLVDALESWSTRGPPENPAAWVHRVARNKILDALRRGRYGEQVPERLVSARPATEVGLDELFVDEAIDDSELRMIFACCHPRLDRADQVALTLKAMCGFGSTEIARALLVSEETIKKRLQRATADLVANRVALDPPAEAELGGRLGAVHQVLYLLFNEGYSASCGEHAIRIELCAEAARLCHLLCSQPRCATPPTHALMALMLFHAARMDARLDDGGSILLMEEQDRSRWDRKLMREARQHLARSAEGKAISAYHLEAGIVALHCNAERYEDTDWHAILRLYDALLSNHPSPVYVLNRAIVVAQIDGPLAGIRALEATSAAGEPSLRRYHLLDATLGELHRRAGNLDRARVHFEMAREKTSSRFEREILDRRLAQLVGAPSGAAVRDRSGEASSRRPSLP